MDPQAKNIDIEARKAEVPRPINSIGDGASSALFLQRYLLEGSFDRGGQANEWFIIPDSLDKVVALLMKLDQDADAENEPRRFEDEREFCMLFMGIMFK